jgi:hypothetical protein
VLIRDSSGIIANLDSKKLTIFDPHDSSINIDIPIKRMKDVIDIVIKVKQMLADNPSMAKSISESGD